MSVPVDYSMCDQTVTVYRQTLQGISRQVLSGCFLQWQETQETDLLGSRCKRSFLLVQPGTEQLVFPGDRIFEGVGPEISPDIWEHFIPEQVPGLGIAAYATAYFWQGEYCHTEAGRKQGSV